jgi:hypothetical protein
MFVAAEISGKAIRIHETDVQYGARKNPKKADNGPDNRQTSKTAADAAIPHQRILEHDGRAWTRPRVS